MPSGIVFILLIWWAAWSIRHLPLNWPQGVSLLQDVKSSKTSFINRTQQCFAVRSGVDGILDLARSTFCRVTEQVHELVDKYKSEYGLDALKVCLQPTTGHMQPTCQHA